MILRILTICVIVLLSNTAMAESRGLTETEQKASYCLAIKHKVKSLLGDQSTSQVDDEIDRIKSLLLPLANEGLVDSIIAAYSRGVKDLSNIDDPEALKRVRRCNNLNFLPY